MGFSVSKVRTALRAAVQHRECHAPADAPRIESGHRALRPAHMRRAQVMINVASTLRPCSLLMDEWAMDRLLEPPSTPIRFFMYSPYAMTCCTADLSPYLSILRSVYAGSING